MAIQAAIFWLHQARPFGLVSHHEEQDADSLGLIDCTWQHAIHWSDALRAMDDPATAADLAGVEYDEVLRGRIIYSVRAGTHIAYSDLNRLNPCLRTAVAAWAGMDEQSIVWRHDQHYTLDRAGRFDLLDD